MQEGLIVSVVNGVDVVEGTILVGPTEEDELLDAIFGRQLVEFSIFLFDAPWKITVLLDESSGQVAEREPGMANDFPWILPGKIVSMEPEATGWRWGQFEITYFIDEEEPFGIIRIAVQQS